MGIWSPVLDNVHEEFASRKESWSGNGSSATVQLRVPWENRFALIVDLLNNARPYPDNDQVDAPHELFASSISDVTPTQAKPTSFASDEKFEYVDALVTVQYNAILFTLTRAGRGSFNGDEVVVTDTVTTSFNTLTSNKTSLYLKTLNDAGDGTRAAAIKDGEEPVKQERTMTYTRKITGLTQLDQSFFDLVDTTNDTQLLSPLLNAIFEIDCLLFKGASETWNSRDRTFSVDLEYLWKQHRQPAAAVSAGFDAIAGHNHVFDFRSGYYSRVFKSEFVDGELVALPITLFLQADHSGLIFPVVAED